MVNGNATTFAAPHGCCPLPWQTIVLADTERVFSLKMPLGDQILTIEKYHGILPLHRGTCNTRRKYSRLSHCRTAVAEQVVAVLHFGRRRDELSQHVLADRAGMRRERAREHQEACNLAGSRSKILSVPVSRSAWHGGARVLSFGSTHSEGPSPGCRV